MVELSACNCLILRSSAFRILLFSALVTLLALQVRYSMTSGMEPDELQFLNNAYAMNDGETLYADIWDNHGPATNYLLAWGLSQYHPDDVSYYLDFRRLGTLLKLVVAVVFGVWAGRFFGNFWMGLLASTLLLATAAQYLKGHELRPDNALTLLFVASLACWFEGWRSRRLAWFFAGGLLIGGGLWFGLKTLLAGVAVGLMFGLWSWQERRLVWKPLVVYGAGSSLMAGGLVAYLAVQGNLGAFWSANFLENLTHERPPVEAGLTTLLRADPICFFTWTVTLIYVGWQFWKCRVPAAVALLSVAAIFMLFQFLFLLPIHNLQSLLITAPPMVLLTLWCVAHAAETLAAPAADWAVPWRGVLAGTGVMLLPVWMMIDLPREGDLPQAVTWERWLLQSVPGDALVMSGEGNPVTRDKPFRYKSFVQMIRKAVNEGDLDLDLVRELDERDVPYTLFDNRLTRMGDELVTFLSEEYLPLDADRLLAAGDVVLPEEEGLATIEIAGFYYWATPLAAEGPASITIDGHPLVMNPVYLSDGVYRIEWDASGPFVLCIAPPELWGNWAATIHHDLPTRRNYPKGLLVSRYW